MAAEPAKEWNVADTPAAAHYIATLVDELAQLAKTHDLEALAYLLEMARLEADQLSKRWAEDHRSRARGAG